MFYDKQIYSFSLLELCLLNNHKEYRYVWMIVSFVGWRGDHRGHNSIVFGLNSTYE